MYSKLQLPNLREIKTMSKPMAATASEVSLFDIIDEDKCLVQGKLRQQEAELVLSRQGFTQTTTPGLWSRQVNGRGQFRKIVPYCATRRATGAD